MISEKEKILLLQAAGQDQPIESAAVAVLDLDESKLTDRVGVKLVDEVKSIARGITGEPEEEKPDDKEPDDSGEGGSGGEEKTDNSSEGDSGEEPDEDEKTDEGKHEAKAKAKKKTAKKGK